MLRCTIYQTVHTNLRARISIGPGNEHAQTAHSSTRQPPLPRTQVRLGSRHARAPGNAQRRHRHLQGGTLLVALQQDGCAYGLPGNKAGRKRVWVRMCAHVLACANGGACALAILAHEHDS